MKAPPVLLVGTGGFLGAISRYLVSVAVTNRLGAAWPYGTFLINLTGCFAIGFVLTLLAERAVPLSESFRFFVPVGFLGAYTTFSSYEFETVHLVQQGEWTRAATYVLFSTLGGYAAVLVGFWLARKIP